MDAEDRCCWAWLGQAVLNCGQCQAERKHKSSFGDYRSNSDRYEGPGDLMGLRDQ